MRWRRNFLFANYHGLVPIRDLLTITCDFFLFGASPIVDPRCVILFPWFVRPQGQRNQARLRGLRCDLRKVFHVLQRQAGTAGRLTSGVGPSAKKQNDQFVWENMMMVCPKMTLFRGHMTWWLNHIRNWMSLYVLRIWKEWVGNLAESLEFDVSGKVVGAITFKTLTQERYVLVISASQSECANMCKYVQMLSVCSG